jgi:hypothetical protein
MKVSRTLLIIFLFYAHIDFHGDPPPRMSIEFRKMLQVKSKTRVGDWYIHRDHIVLVIYGSKVHPYLLQVYLPPPIFALEYIWQRLVF